MTIKQIGRRRADEKGETKQKTKTTPATKVSYLKFFYYFMFQRRKNKGGQVFLPIIRERGRERDDKQSQAICGKRERENKIITSEKKREGK